MFPPREANISCHVALFIQVGVVQGVLGSTEKRELIMVKKTQGI